MVRPSHIDEERAVSQVPSARHQALSRFRDRAGALVRGGALEHFCDAPSPLAKPRLKRNAGQTGPRGRSGDEIG